MAPHGEWGGTLVLRTITRSSEGYFYLIGGYFSEHTYARSTFPEIPRVFGNACLITGHSTHGRARRIKLQYTNDPSNGSQKGMCRTI